MRSELHLKFKVEFKKREKASHMCQMVSASWGLIYLERLHHFLQQPFWGLCDQVHIIQIICV